ERLSLRGGGEGNAPTAAESVAEQSAADKRADHRIVTVIPRTVLVPCHRCLRVSWLCCLFGVEPEPGVSRVKPVEDQRRKRRVAQEEVQLRQLRKAVDLALVALGVR